MKFNSYGWIVVNHWATCPHVGEYLETLRFDSIEGAEAFLAENPDAYLDSQCKEAA